MAKPWTPCPKTQDRKPKPRRKKLMFSQEHPPGREAQVDFTHYDRLEVTIQGEPFVHLLFDFRLSHSGWTYVEVASGETVAALMQGLRHAFEELGAVPKVLRKNRHGSAVWGGDPTEPFKAFLSHYGFESSLTNQGKPWENGGVEKNNGRVKDAIEQALLIRGNADFESREAYEDFVRNVVNWINRRPEVQEKLVAERECLTQLPTNPAPDYSVKERKVNEYGLINVESCQYSVPAELLGKWVEVGLYADHLEVYPYQDSDRGLLVRWDRIHKNNGVKVDPAHVAPALLQKPAAFSNLREDIKEHLFPRHSFRRAHEKLHEWARQDPGTNRSKSGIPVQACMMEGKSEAEAMDDAKRKTMIANAEWEYLRILNLAVSEGREDEVDQALEESLDSDARFCYEEIKQRVTPCASGR